MNLIFDLDQTLVNTEALEPHRKSRNWRKVYSLIPTIGIFQGFETVLQKLKADGHRIAIVTSSPSIYCSKVLSHCKIECDAMVCYHDTKRRKPHPEPFLLAIEKLGIDDEELAETLSFGDKAADIIASREAKIKAVACLWGTNEPQELLAAKPDHKLERVQDILDLVKFKSQETKSFKI